MMEEKNGNSSAREEGEITDEGEELDLEVIDEWRETSPHEQPKKSEKVANSHQKDLPKAYSRSSKSTSPSRSSRRKGRDKENRHEHRSTRSKRHDRDRDRHERSRVSPVRRRPSSRFWDRHRAATPRIQDTVKRWRTRSQGSPSSKENGTKRDSETDESSLMPPPSTSTFSANAPPPPPPVPGIQEPHLPPELIASKKKAKQKLSGADRSTRGILSNVMRPF